MTLPKHLWHQNQVFETAIFTWFREVLIDGAHKWDVFLRALPTEQGQGHLDASSDEADGEHDDSQDNVPHVDADGKM